jgi:hypothetical protein
MITYENDIPGYDYGTPRVPRSPVTLEALEKLKRAAGFTDADQGYLKMAAEILAPQAEAMVDAWRSRIGEQEFLRKWFAGPGGKPDERYKSAVKPRFVQWVRDICLRPYDQAWLDYQEEIGARHTPEKKNVTDGVQAPPLLPLRYLMSFTAVIVTSAREFLVNSRYSPDDIERMQMAWTKAVMLTITLWSRPYTKDELW